MAIELTLDPEEVTMRLANAASTRTASAVTNYSYRMAMSPERAATDEFDHEAQSYQMLGAIELFSNSNPRVPRDEIRNHPYRAKYIQRRAEEIRQERAQNFEANLAMVEHAIGRVLTETEREAMRTLLEAPVAKAEKPWTVEP